jgi:hypothetical protein
MPEKLAQPPLPVPLQPLVPRAGIEAADPAEILGPMDDQGARRVGRSPAGPGRADRSHYREAGDRAEATQLYRQARSDLPGPQRSLALGRALGWQGEQHEARTLIEEACAAFEAAGAHAAMATARLLLADLSLTSGDYAGAGRLAEQALALNGVGDPFTAASANILIATAARVRGDLEVAQRHIDTSIGIARADQLTEVQMYAAVGLSNIRAEQGDNAGALAAARQVAELAQIMGNSFYEVVGHNNAAYRATLLDDYAAAHAHIDAGLTLAEARGLEMPRQWLYSTRGELALAEEQWVLAEEWLERARAEAGRQHNRGQLAVAEANRAAPPWGVATCNAPPSCLVEPGPRAPPTSPATSACRSGSGWPTPLTAPATPKRLSRPGTRPWRSWLQADTRRSTPRPSGSSGGSWQPRMRARRNRAGWFKPPQPAHVHCETGFSAALQFGPAHGLGPWRP